MKTDVRFKDLFEKEIFDFWNISEEFMDEQILIYSNNSEVIKVGQKVKLAIDTILPSELYQYDFIQLKSLESIKQKWAI